jgi:aryl-alcohol dehydrogenase-like predicted oxidoreductase
MKLQPLGPVPLNVSTIGLGCMGMSEFYGPRDDVQSSDTLSKAFELGVNFFDTADMYGQGHNETLIGEFARKANVRPILATKFGIVRATNGSYERRIDNSPAYVKLACEQSLKRMNVEVIDLYYVHRIEAGRPIEEVMDSLARLIADGKIRAVGLCEPSEKTLRRAHAVFPLSAVQSEYSLWSRDPENDGVLDACRELGIGFVAYSPLGRGLLTGKVTATHQLGSDDMRRSLPRFAPDNMPINLGRTAKLHEIATRNGCTIAQIALAWLRHKGDNLVAIPGVRRTAHLEENIASLRLSLSKSDIADLENAFPPGAASGARYTEEGFKGVGL